jgi:hypothetical protein
MNKAGSLPSGRVVLSLALKRYYEPLRLPLRPLMISAPALYITVGGPVPPPQRVSRAALYFFRHMPPLLPRKNRRNASVLSFRRLRPSPLDHRVGFFKLVTRLLIGSLALRPATLPMENLQPPVTRTLLPGAKEVYGQLLLLDFNQPDLQPFTAYGQACFIVVIGGLGIGCHLGC